MHTYGVPILSHNNCIPFRQVPVARCAPLLDYKSISRERSRRLKAMAWSNLCILLTSLLTPSEIGFWKGWACTWVSCTYCVYACAYVWVCMLVEMATLRILVFDCLCICVRLCVYKICICLCGCIHVKFAWIKGSLHRRTPGMSSPLLHACMFLWANANRHT
jgi:hypothetical protein